MTAYRFEAEEAKIYGTTSNENHFCTARSTEFSPDFSGNVALCNLGTAMLQFTFTSDKAVSSVIRIRMANPYGVINGTLSDYANITVNDNSVDLSVTFDGQSGEVASGSSQMYFKMITVETKISLAQGENVLSVGPAQGNVPNLDYIEIYTSAVLEDETEATVTNPSSFVNVVTKPTETAEGQIGFACHNKKEGENEVVCKNDNARKRTLPALTSEIYEFQELGNGERYVIEMYGGKATIVSTETFKLTLQGATIDGKTTVTKTVGEKIDLSTAEFDNKPEGTIVRYWYNVADITEIYEDFKNFTVPDADITIAPAFDKEVYANRDGSTDGKIATFPYYGYAEMITTGGTQPAGGYVRLIEDSGVKGRDAYWGYVGTGESRDMGAIYYWKGKNGAALANGFYFTHLSPYKVESKNNYTIATTIQNQGDKAITLKIYKSNSSSAPKTGAASETITLQPGEVKTVTLSFSYNNNNILTTVELLTDGITDLKIGMYQYIEYA